MTLFGLDLAKNSETGEYKLLELSGIGVGMKGFEQIYEDKRVEYTVLELLEHQYGKLSTTSPVHVDPTAFLELQKDFSNQRKNRSSKLRDFVMENARDYDHIKSIAKILYSPYAITDWRFDYAEHSSSLSYPVPKHVEGDGTTVLYTKSDDGTKNNRVNSYVQETIASNKFLQSQLLQNSDIQQYILPCTPVGLGITNEDILDDLLNTYSSFVLKPILGQCGKGVEFLNRKEVQKDFKNTRGISKPIDIKDAFLTLFARSDYYLEELITINNFVFEDGVALIQPFVQTKKDEEYSSIRVVVCNGQFIDAYARVSDDKRVNLSRGAEAVALDDKEKDTIKNISEDIISSFLGKVDSLDPKSFQKDIYNDYFDQRGRITKSEKQKLFVDEFLEWSSLFVDYFRFITTFKKNES